MAELFSETWMNTLKDRWNADPDIVEPLKQAGFSSRIAYGFTGEGMARGMLIIDDGEVTYAGEYDGRDLDWDLRAEPDRWQAWIDQGFGLTKLGPAVATKALVFATGNYRQMIRTPSLSAPFLQHFKHMGGI